MTYSVPQRIPILDLQKQYQQVGADVEKVVVEVLRSGSYILGQNVAALEKEIARLSSCAHGIGVANGTDALILALWALEIGPGDEVITPAFTFAATAEAIALRGAKAVFVDVDPVTFNLNPALVEKALTANTRAILPVHLYGQPADMDPIRAIAAKHGLKIVEDNAQAIAATYKGIPTGSLSDLACISFYPTKNLGAAGDAGMVVTDNPELAHRLRCLRAHGSHQRYYHERLGVNSRLDEIQAAVLLVKLRHLLNWNESRRQVAHWYDEALRGCPQVVLPAVMPATTHVWHQYTIRVTGQGSTSRDAVKSELAKRGIDSMCYYPVPLHMQEAFAYLGYKKGDLPVSEMLAQQVLSLPMYPELSQDQVAYLAQSLRQITDTSSAAFAGAAVQPVTSAF